MLSHLRWIAALVVAFSHIRQSILVDAAYEPDKSAILSGSFRKPLFAPQGYGHAAVIVFFVLSGFLVGGKLIQLFHSRQVRSLWPKFLIDRFSRIFIVLWPALVLTIICIVIITFLAPDAPFVNVGYWTFDLTHPVIEDLNFRRWLCAGILLNEFLSPTLRSNAPLWSLAYEWAYYIISLSFLLVARRIFSIGAIFVILYGVLLIILAVINQPDILISGVIWVAGILARVAFDRKLLRGKASLILSVILVALVLIIEKRHPEPDIVLGIAIAFLIANVGWAEWNFGKKIGLFLSNFSYSLYTTHFPVMLLVMAIGYHVGLFREHLLETSIGLSFAIGTATMMLLSAFIFSRFTEAKTGVLRKWILIQLKPSGRLP